MPHSRLDSAFFKFVLLTTWFPGLGFHGGGRADDLENLKTVAEKSGFTATCLHRELLEFQDKLAGSAKHVSNIEIGRTVNGRLMQATIVARPSYQFGNRQDKRLVVLLLGNIHSGECAGKEGLLMMLRELAIDPEHRWLKNLVIVCLPNYNADGNDRIGRNELHRPGQLGPSSGMGLRENAQQLDLNRDFIKIESPEARALVNLINNINPHLFIDCHTTNGSRHRYPLTYDIPHNPTAPVSLRDFMRNQMMPTVTGALEKKGISTFYYGNFSRDQTRWMTYGHEPRYSTEYVGLRGRLSVLSEAYSYIPYKDRIVASKEFVTACVDFVHENADQVNRLLAKIAADSRTGEQELSLAAEVRPFGKKFTLKGYQGNTDRPKDVEVDFFGDYVSTRKKSIPKGYLLGPSHGRVVDRLLMHGVQVAKLDPGVELEVEKFQIETISRSREFQKHSMLTLKGKWTASRFKSEPGYYFVSTSQPLGRLVAYLLEPESDDGLVTWNFFDSSVETSSVFPVFAFRGDIESLKLSDVDQVEPRRRFSIDELYGLKGKINFGGNASPSLKWVSPTRYQMDWNGRPVFVEAETGSLERKPTVTQQTLINKISQIEGVSAELATVVSNGKSIQVANGVVINGASDLYWVPSQDDKALRLTSDKAKEELVTASPDGKHIAFVKGNNLHRVDLQTGVVKKVTSTGTENLLHGKLDWVYQEELYGRGDFKGFWWSPDSKSLAYLTLDQSHVKRYQVTDNIPVRQSHEVYPYPKAGDPNPTVSISVDGQQLDVSTFGIKQPLISRVCWSPQGHVVFQLQNRIQNQINLVSWKPGKPPEVLVSESVEKGWIESPGNPIWVKGRDGFIWFTHRGGRRHIATYSDKGQLLEAGAGFTHRKNDRIEVRELTGATRDAVFFVAANPGDVTRLQLYRLNSNGTSTAITNTGLNHSVVANSSLTYFFDFESSISMPTRVALRRMDGSFVRYVEANLVDELDYYDIVQPVFQRVPTRDGDQMDSMLILPPDFDESRKYPVLMHVYAGPQAPRVRNRWGGTSYLWHQMLAQKGFVIWMCDNRSATHHGMNVTYSIYGDLGRKELMDIEDSVSWLKKKDWVDTNRIGIWGWSYGGYMTSYAMTHSRTFKVGISGAPVTDWRNYDSIYTERYMGLPSENKIGYDASSVVLAAKKLHGKMLIIHGTQDDNVHISNTYQLIDALQKAGKHFDLMIYPQNRHGIRVPGQTRHLRQLMTDFIVDNL